MKERGMIFNSEMVRALLDGRKTQTRRPIKTEAPVGESPAGRPLFYDKHGRRTKPKCPFGTVGDRIWVRETFASVFKDSGPVCYRATDSSMHSGSWTPSIHMPRWASRILLEITNIRVERIEDISDDDAMREGITDEEALSYPCIDGYRVGYSRLWESLYGNWDSNPWVWVIEFKRVKP